MAKSLIEKVKRFIEENSLIQEHDRVLVGISGGADSVCLLIILERLRREKPFKLYAAHLNHKLRKEADEEEEFVKKLCSNYGIEIYSEAIDIKAIKEKTKKGSIEELARKERYGFFKRALDYFEANKLALAHHQDDQVETIIFNLIRGSHIHGLRGILPIRRFDSLKPDTTYQKRSAYVIRPLLCTDKNEIIDFLRGENIEWREDRTNYELITSRNIIRNIVIPTFNKISPDYKTKIIAVAQSIRELEEIIDSKASKIYKAVKFDRDKSKAEIELWRLKTENPLIATELIRRMIIAITGSCGRLSNRHLKSVLRVDTLRRKKIQLPYNLEARYNEPWLIIEKKTDQDKEKRENTPSYTLKLEVNEKDLPKETIEQLYRTKSRFEEFIDKDKIKGELTIRRANREDLFIPLGLSYPKNIYEFAKEARLSLDKGEPLWVVQDEEKIIWLVGYRIDDRVKITESTKKVLHIRAVRNT